MPATLQNPKGPAVPLLDGAGTPGRCAPTHVPVDVDEQDGRGSEKEPGAVGDHGELGAVASTQLGEDAADVNLADLAPGIQVVIMRFFAATSNIVTGVVLGALSGVVAWILSTIMRRQP